MTVDLDTLTGLLTNQSFLEHLDAAARSTGSLVLITMDLDHFLSFNEKYGHAAGDDWIKAMAERFARAFQGEGSLFARTGGDEFMAAVPAQDLFEVYHLAEALRAQIEQDGPAIPFNGEQIHPGSTISLGLAALPGHAADVAELVEKSRQSLLRAKVAGGNRVCIYEDTDLLTGLLNYDASQSALEEALAHAKSKNEPVAVFMIDIDHFKEINDEFGHRAGDEVLKRLAHILESNFHDLGPVGRVGGEEFLVVLPGHRAESAFILAEEVRKLVEDSEIDAMVGARSFSLRFKISGGIATAPSDASERVDLLRKADEALYHSKQVGRNRISLPASAQMVTKTSYYTQTQLERLAKWARKLDKTEAFLLREALDDLLRKYGDSAENK